MSLSIRDLVNNPVLHTRLITNKIGLNQIIRWAHVCELDDPTEWLGTGDLLMTTGIGIPVIALEQEQYITRLANADLAGIAIGENMQAPDDLNSLIETAKKLNFPVLITAYHVPFSAITKIVLEEKEQQDYVQRKAIIQVYETAKLSIQGIGLKTLLSHLQRNIKSQLYLLNPKTAKPWASDLAELPEELMPFFQTIDYKDAAVVPSMQKISVLNEKWQRVIVPSKSEAMIVVKDSDWVDYILLSHVAAVIGIELERVRFEFENFLRLGGEAFDELLVQRTPKKYILERLTPFKLDLSQARIWKTNIQRPMLNQWNEILCKHQIRILLKKQSNAVIGLVENINIIPVIQKLLGCAIGYSNPVNDVSRVSESIREASLALEYCDKKQLISAYNNYSVMQPWLPKNLDEAEQIFNNILGDLANYDRINNTQLLKSLYIFLQCNNSWQSASEQLNVHKQTLIYRIKKVEEITGRSLKSIEDITILWFAIKSGQFCGLM